MKINVLNGGLAPQRGHATDAGADLFARIDNNKGAITIAPHETIKIPLGVSLELDDNTMAVVYNRSSMAARGLAIANAPVDKGYTGEIHAIITNTSNLLHSIKNGEKIAQLVILPIIMPEVEVKNEGKTRGNGAFGSTND